MVEGVKEIYEILGWDKEAKAILAAALKNGDVEAKAAAAALNGHGPSDGSVLLTIEFRFPRPSGHFGKRGLRPSAPPTMFRRPDLDKLVRAILDALTDAGAFRDDAQVDEIRARKRYCTDGESPGVKVVIA